MDAWIAPETAPWFSLLSLTASVAGLDHFAQRGQLRGIVSTVYGATALIGLALLAAAAIALASGQRWHVPFALGFPGAIMLVACTWAFFDLGRVYGEAELRKSIAKDI